MRTDHKSPAVSFLLCAAAWISAGTSPQEKVLSGSTIVVSDTLNVAAVRREYGEGNFESLTQALESFRGHGHVLRRQDSLVVAKYLGVIYAADPATREKGKYWLFKMLEMDPGAGIVDLFVSEEIHSTFDRAKQELNLEKQMRGARDSASKATAAPLVAAAPPSQSEAVKLAAENPDRRWTWNLNLTLGRKFMEKEFIPVANQSAGRFVFEIRRRSWPIGIVTDIVLSSKTDSNPSFISRKSATTEFGAGIRKTWGAGDRLFHPHLYLGADLQMIAAAVDTGAKPEWNRSVTGLNVETGLDWVLWRHFDLGVDWSYSVSETTFRRQKVNPGGFFGGILFGYHY